MEDDRKQALMQQADALREGTRLGRSPALRRMFDYLVAESLEDRAPKEIEVAAAVFGRGEGFDTMQDASVRVYAHRLRKKIDEFYAGPGTPEPWRLTMQKGEYRIGIERGGDAPPLPEPPPRQEPTPLSPAPRRARWPLAVAGLVFASLLVAIAWLAFRGDGDDRDLADIRASALWRGIVGTDRPIVIAVGDYYVFGEADQHGRVARLVREFAINSRYDLDEKVMRHPELNGRYVDLGLHYYPIGVGAALADVLPIVRGRRAAGMGPIRVMPASSLTPEVLRTCNVIYIGYLSGLGVLRNPVFNGSRYAVGDSYDELVDKRTGHDFTATTGEPVNAPQREFGYVGLFRGPGGNSFLIVAGMRDAAMVQAADFVSHAATARQIEARARGAAAFEALLGVETVGNQNLAGKLLLVSPLDSPRIWRDGAPQDFPDDAHTGGD